jgi:capsular polysaccharide biosynthesis protein
MAKTTKKLKPSVKVTEVKKTEIINVSIDEIAPQGRRVRYHSKRS